MANFLNTKDHTAEFAADDIKQNKAMGILAYVSLLVLIPIFAAKDSKWARFHANNGLILAAAEVSVWIVFGLLGLIPYVGLFFSLIGWLCNLVLIALSVFEIVFAAQGKARELPIIGNKIQFIK